MRYTVQKKPCLLVCLYYTETSVKAQKAHFSETFNTKESLHLEHK